MAYTINRTDGTVVATVADGAVDFTRTLGYVGKNYANYGEIFNENFVKLQENFSNVSPPTGPIEGQLWWDKTNLALKIYRGASLGWQQVQTTGNVTFAGNTITVSNTSPVVLTSGSSIQLNTTTRVEIISKPIKMANLTTTQRDALAASNGDVIYNSTAHKFQGYANGTWVDLH